MEVKNRVAVIVSSCDYFSDCWTPFIKSFEDNWKDCPFEVYIITNGKQLPDTNCNIRTLNVGIDQQWGSNTLKALRHINADWIIYLQEDYFLEHRVNTDRMLAHINYCSKYGIDYLRLSFPFMEKTPDGNGYYILDYKLKYAVCLQAALWRKESLEKVIVEGWTGWDFEYKIAKHLNTSFPEFQARGLAKSDCSEKGFIYVEGTAVRKGRWTRAAVKYLCENGFCDLVGLRPIEGPVLSFFHSKRIFPLFSAVGAHIMNKFKWNF